MQNFHFPLDRILSWRRKELEAEQAQMAPLVAEQNRLEAERREIAAASHRAGAELLASGEIRGTDLAALGSYRAHLERETRRNERERADAGERMDRQRARVMERHRRVRLLDKLRERRVEEWRSEWNREMESFAGEAFLARWNGRKKRLTSVDDCGGQA